MEKFNYKPQPEQPIYETSENIVYLGVCLPKAKNTEGLFVPQIEHYADYINDEFSLKMQRDIAISFLQGDPLLIEGGTSIGKTTTVRKMAAELGYEVHYVNLNGATDVEDLMGRYVPNPNKNGPDDPEFIFVDGRVTSGLRQEKSKIKIIILDEFNSATPNILIRLHEVLDAINRGESVTLTEDASESIPVNKAFTKIVALMNPPGKGYIGRQPLDPAQLRRWVYFKAPSELTDKSLHYFMDALFFLTPNKESIPTDSFIISNNYVLTPEQLQKIPRIKLILKRYFEFHKAVKKMVKGRRVAADQPQSFSYDDRMEPKRVRDFILRFYDGDITKTFQTAIRYYYLNKLASNVDKSQVEELIKYVGTDTSKNISKRKKINLKATSTETRSDETTEEKNTWTNILGKEMKIEPLPSYITPEVKINLEHLGFKLCYIPKIDLGKLEDLQQNDIKNYLDNLQSQYPNWHPYESLSGKERSDHNTSRNLNIWFWKLVMQKKIKLPKLPGNWVAIETIQKPSSGNYYPSSLITKILGLSSRLDVPFDEIDAAISSKKIELLKEMGLPVSLNIRMLETVEWNLLANRYGWGSSDTFEWTNTQAHDTEENCQIISGRSDGGGAAYAFWLDPLTSNNRVGFRVAAVLK